MRSLNRAFLALIAALPLILPCVQAQAQGSMSLDQAIATYIAQPVSATLAGSSATQVTDADYAEIVEGGQGPAMVLFYYDNDNNEIGCQGLAGMAVILSRMFPDIAFHYYVIGDFADLTRANLDAVLAKYPIEDAPALIFYDADGGSRAYATGLHGGVTEAETLLKNIAYSSYYITQYILD